MPTCPWYADAPLSMAHLCELETPPAALIALAAECGLASVGFRVEPAAAGGVHYPLASAADRAEVRRRAADTGVGILYVELIAITDRTIPASHRRTLDIAAEIGAARICVAGDSPDLARVAGHMAAICAMAAPLGLAVDIEFMPFRGVRTLRDAVAVVERTGMVNAHILIDALHVVRSGTPVAEIARLDPRHVGTFHICDAPLAPPADGDLIAEARLRRLAPGDGGLPLQAMLDVLPPGTPIGVEVPLPVQQPAVASRRRLSALAARTRRMLRA